MRQRFPWIAQQKWEDILFIHTPFSPQFLQGCVPAPFTIDTYNGQAWLTLVLFRATNSRPRFFPSWLSYPDVHQMNLRTYVTFGSESGVYFFSIHSDSLAATIGGNAVALPFQQAPMTIRKEGHSFHFTGSRWAREKIGKLQIAYQPDTTSFTPQKDSLAHFLTERYSILKKQGNRIVKGTISHGNWLLQEALLSKQHFENIPFCFTPETLGHYSAQQHTVLYPFEKAGIFNS